ncbi:MAG: methyl-accepting chemotaxis protein [Arenibacterium sp.]
MAHRFVMHSLKRGMVLSVSVPLVIAIASSFLIFLGNWQQYSSARAMYTKKDFISTMGALIHEQQKERGATSIFLSSGGTQFRDELSAQRRLTDQAAARFRERLKTSDIDRASAIGRRLEQVDAALNGRAALRQGVDALSIATPKALGQYTAHNAQMLKTISLIGAAKNNAEVASQVAVLESLLTAKEFAGIERAIGSGGFAAGAFDLDRIRFLERLVTQQNASLARFANLATENYAREVEAIADLDETADILRMRGIAIDSFGNGDLQGIPPEDFFSATTVRINRFKALEDQMVQDIITNAQTILRSSLISMLLAVGGVVFALVFSVAVTAYVIRNMLKCVRQISDAGDQLARGDENAQLPTDSPRELGRIVWSINFFRESVEKAKKREAEIAQERVEAEKAARALEEENQRQQKEQAEQEAAKARAEQQRMNQYVSEMSEMVAACARGDFSQKLDLEGQEGVLAEISSGLNKISEGVEGSLSEIRTALGHLTAGDLTYRMSGNFEGIFAEIAEAVAEAMSNMSQTLVRVSASSQTVSVSSDQISSTTQELARRSEENARMLQNTASSIAGMSEIVKSATNASQDVRRNVLGVSQQAADDSQIATKAIDAMEEIRSSSEEIMKILSVIDEIAFQTNLLALNAGVEAARAGEAGKGFAVVATEVRALAQRSSEAGKEITHLLEASAENVLRGVEMVDQTAKSLNNVVANVRDISVEIGEITDSFENTQTRLDEVSQATRELDQVTRENVNMIDQAHQSVRLLTQEAQTLNSEVQTFQVEMRDAPAAPGRLSA